MLCVFYHNKEKKQVKKVEEDYRQEHIYIKFEIIK